MNKSCTNKVDLLIHSTIYVLERSSEYTVGVPQSSTIGGELYAYNFFLMRHMCFFNLRVLLEFLFKILANIAIYYAILIILQVYTSSFTQFRPLLL